MKYKKHIVPILITAVTLFVDLYSKHLAVMHLSNFKKIDFFNGFIRFDLTYNRGGVFGILQGYKNLFLVVSLIVLGLMVAYYLYESAMPDLFRYSMALIIGGAAGNIIDRLIPGRVGVVDFISVGIDNVFRWYTFNIADAAIVMGAVMLGILIYREEKNKGKEAA